MLIAYPTRFGFLITDFILAIGEAYSPKKRKSRKRFLLYFLTKESRQSIADLHFRKQRGLDLLTDGPFARIRYSDENTLFDRIRRALRPVCWKKEKFPIGTRAFFRSS